MTEGVSVNWESCGIYIHVPFCLRKCSYCDFVSYPLSKKDVNLYSKALCREINLHGSFNERPFSSLYVGGGTPSCLTVLQLSKIMEKVMGTFNFVPGAEFTIEANPGTVDIKKLSALRKFGFNRISIGIQSFNDEILGVLGRKHSAREAIQAVKDSREAGFENISIDLIYGVPGLSLLKWRETLELAVDLVTEHISAYCLQLEPGTPLYERVRSGAIQACPEELELEMYLETIKTLESSGYTHYEISNFARRSFEGKHNLIYWHNGAYLGLGPAAHSYWGGYRIGNEIGLGEYERKIEDGVKPIMSKEKIDEKMSMGETMFLGLRKTEGVNTKDFMERFGKSIDSVYGDII
ncbi:MAG TPA: radical SAM family heme chaperone HemW, partial [Clostridia bacterium]|nr:radical SAM family heme chaperone HemW [Clostridia bacterium]